jgi:hypothetical protein
MEIGRIVIQGQPGQKVSKILPQPIKQHGGAVIPAAWNTYRASGVAQTREKLLSKRKALSSNPSTTTTTIKKKIPFL